MPVIPVFEKLRQDRRLLGGQPELQNEILS
jgi:hypothetical protein